LPRLDHRSTRLGNALIKPRRAQGRKSRHAARSTVASTSKPILPLPESAPFSWPLNFRARGNELEYMLNSSEATVLLVGERYVDLVNSIKDQLKSVKTYISTDKPHPGMLYYEDLLKHSTDRPT